MNGYASSGGGEAASLSSSLLARKGQALPAVDADAHEGVNIDMHASYMASGKRVSDPVQKSAPVAADVDVAEPAIVDERPIEADNVRVLRPRNEHELLQAQDEPIRERAAPQTWTIVSARGVAASGASKAGQKTSGPTKPIALLPAPCPPEESAQEGEQTPESAERRPSRVRTTFRMPTPDFVRLRHASRGLNQSCQAIILDALEAYMDAKGIDRIGREEADAEAARLIRNS